MTDHEIQKLIENVDFFKGLEKKDYELIVSLGKIVSIGIDEILFNQGDSSDYLYIVISGKLSAQVTKATGEILTVGTISQGQTLGELGVISSNIRSATVSALTDSILLALSEKDFKKIGKLYPQILISLISFVVNRSHDLLNIIKFPDNKKINQTVMIYDKKIPIIQRFIEEFKLIAPLNIGIFDIEQIISNANTSESELFELLDNLSDKLANNIFLIDIQNIKIIHILLKKIQKTYILYSDKCKNILSNKIKEILLDSRKKFGEKNYLVRIHEDENDNNINRNIYNLPFINGHHHIHIGIQKDYERFARYILGKQIGLVLGGGGVKGWVHFGAIKALQDLDIPIDMIGGSSSGAIAAACFSFSKNYNEALINFTKIMKTIRKPFKISNLTYPTISIFSGKSGTIAMQEVFKNTRIEDLLLPFFCISSNLTENKETVHVSGEIWEALRASVAIPGMLPPVIIDGLIHADGGLINNLPVDQMKLLLGEESKIIAVSVGRKKYQTNYKFPSILTISDILKYKMGLAKYQFPSFGDFFLNSLLAGSTAKEINSCEVASLLITPDTAKFKMVGIKKFEEKKLLKIGYKATIEAFKKNKIINFN